MNDKDILKELIQKYGADELKKMIDDVNIRQSFKYSTGEHSIKLVNNRIDSQSPGNSHIIVYRGYGWRDFVRFWNHISTNKRNQFYDYDFNALERYLDNQKWYILRPSDVKDFKYFICREHYISK